MNRTRNKCSPKGLSRTADPITAKTTEQAVPRDAAPRWVVLRVVPKAEAWDPKVDPRVDPKAEAWAVPRVACRTMVRKCLP